MANDLKLTITAIDKATATIKRINDSMNRSVSPIRDMKKLGAEVAKNPAIDGLKRMGGAASGAAKSISKITGPLLGITGLGTIAGLAEMTAQWARLGQTVGNTTISLGVTTRGLTTMRYAARMAGLSAETMDGGLEALRQTMQDAQWGRNPHALMLMNRLHMAFKYTKDGAVDVIETLKDVADGMAIQPDVGAKHTIAQAFGIDGLFPLLVKGRQAIDDYQKEMEKLGALPTDDQIKKTTEYAQSLERLKAGLDGVSHRIGDKMQHATKPLIDAATEKITKDPAQSANLGWEFMTRPAFVVGLQHLLFKSVEDRVREAQKRHAYGKIKPLGASEAPPAALPGLSSSAANPVASAGVAAQNAGLPMGIRSNNPLNLSPRGREAVFPTMELGIAAAYRDLYGKIGRGINTPAAIVNAWTPPGVPGKSPDTNANYTRAIESAIGTGPIDRDNPQVMAKLISAMARFENGGASADRAGLDQQIQHFVIEFKNAPPGTVATARKADGSSVPVRIASALPTAPGGI